MEFKFMRKINFFKRKSLTLSVSTRKTLKAIREKFVSDLLYIYQRDRNDYGELTYRHIFF